MNKPILDADTQQLLAELAAAEGPSFDDMTVPERRLGLEAMFLETGAQAPTVAVREFQLPSRQGVPIHGLALQPDGEADAPLPVLFMMQGGGWALSGARPYVPLGALLANALGRLVVLVDFRLAPEHKFPAGLDDCTDTYAWLRENAGQLGGDPDNIALFGDSAGGNLAAAVALRCARAGERLPEALVLAYPMIDVRIGADRRYPSRQMYGGGDYFLTEASVQAATLDYLEFEGLRDHPLVSLAGNPDLAKLPKTVLVLPGLDPLRDEGLAFADRLEAEGVEVHCRVFEGTIHAFLSLFHRIAMARDAVAFIRSRL
ncbi:MULTISPECIES: alpha/beta hydrolase [Kordiimonas]|jgi:acetyl esterase|uniref:alpha/beta hydrolase n=1 Tax=Kordiimonas TaxID=288021 RepID=UPI00257C46CF|nr:alpha/beta hydrolase [Kordiimonas sp. UBA4487]